MSARAGRRALLTTVLGGLLVVGTACAGSAASSAKAAAPAASGQYAKPGQLPADGTFLRVQGGSAVFIMEGGQKRVFTNWDTFLSWGGKADFSNVVQLPRDQVDGIPSGEPIAAGAAPPKR